MIFVPVNRDPTNLYVVRGNLNHHDESMNTSNIGSFNTGQLSPSLPLGKFVLGLSPYVSRASLIENAAANPLVSQGLTAERHENGRVGSSGKKFILTRL